MTHSFSLTCSQCGGKIEVRGTTPKVTCSYCGTEQILSSEIQEMMKDESWVVCPVCKRNDRMEKVTAVVIHGYYGNNALLSSQLKLKEPEYYDLTPPIYDNAQVPPRSKMAEGAFASLFLVIVSCIAWWFLTTGDTLESFVCGVVVFIIAFFAAIPLFNLPAAIQEENARKVMMLTVKRAEEIYQEKLTQYQKERKKRETANEQMRKRHNLKMKVWDDLYYCFRDDVVCLPVDGLSARVEDMEKFVNWYVDNRMKGE